MSDPVALLVGGTKILERELQSALGAHPLVVVGTMEDAMRVMGEKPVRLAVLGPTLRRSLAMVSTLRREGQAEPRLMVVYRDDQRDEVKRHQRGKAVADRYIAQSRIHKEVAPATSELWQATATGELDVLPVDALSDDVPISEASTRMMDVLPLDDELPPPTGLTYDTAAEAPTGELLEAFDPSLLEEVAEGEAIELEEIDLEPLDAAALEDLPEATAEEVEMLADGDLEELNAGEVVEELEAVELVEDLEDLPLATEAEQPPAVQAEQASPAEVAMVDEVLDLAAEELAVEEALELADESLLEEVTEGELRVEGVAVQDVAGDDITAEDLDAETLLEEVALVEEVAAVQEAPAAEATAPASRAVDLDGPTAPARHPSLAAVPPPQDRSQPSTGTPAPPVVPVAGAVAQVVMPNADARSSGVRAASSGAYAMLSELTGFVEKLQEATNHIAHLEAENEQLRTALAHAQASARPELENEVGGLRNRVSELQLRLQGAEEARSVAVEARMKAEMSQQHRDDELGRLRGELQAALARSSSLEAQLEARQRLAADAARSLRQVAELLDA